MGELLIMDKAAASATGALTNTLTLVTGEFWDLRNGTGLVVNSTLR